MFADANREQLRRMYLDAWSKYRQGQPLEPLQAQLAALIAEHPEYVPWLETGDSALYSEFKPESGQLNPFLHLSLHLALREQVATDRPRGIAELHTTLSARAGGPHEAEHRMLEVLGETLWEAQQSGAAPDEKVYLERLRKLR